MLRFHSVGVRDVQPEAEDALRVILDVPPELQGIFRTRAGQHIVLRDWLDGTQVRRTYSPTGAAGELPLTLGIRIQPRGRLSQHLLQILRPGRAVEVMPPGGSFGAALAPPLPAGASYVVFVAGSGITPVLSIVRTALAEQPRSSVTVFYGNRTSARTMFLEDLQGLKDRYLSRLAVHFLMSAEPQESELLNGRIDAAKTRELARSFFDPQAVDAYFLCGPGDMMEQVAGALRALGAAPERIHAERFTVGERSETQSPAEPAGTPEQHAGPKPTDAPAPGMTEVTVLMDGRRRTFSMRTGEESILDAAARAGLELPYSCRAGVCSTCRTKLVRGEVDLRANYALEDWELEQGFILACQSHAKSAELELDYDAR
ncbi:MAG TPA: 2Fe-2S iron-sulfur cluster-binding protein [Steroidobacteraceae bacterium]|nr:2Fe-2S iron-sulfur cluster-binding protein [Steroidobacteraceae bacterium]